MIDLHLHLDGSLNPEDMPKLAELSGITLQTVDIESLRAMMTVEEDCTSLGEYLEKFELPLKVLQTEEGIRFAVYRLLETLKEQGLCYAEIRFAPQLHQQKGLTQTEVVKAAVEGLEKAKKELDMPSQLILCCMRSDDNHEENLETVKTAAEFVGKGVCAVDLAGNEAAYPTELFKDVFKSAQEYGVPIIIHAGEAAGAESMRQAIRLGARRIGHGIRAMGDENLIRELGERKLFLEMCYTSNLQTKAVDVPEHYPIEMFLKSRVYVTINTDNMTVSGTTLLREYHLLKEKFHLSDETMLQIAINAADAAFVTDTEREGLKEQIRTRFFDWIEKVK